MRCFRNHWVVGLLQRRESQTGDADVRCGSVVVLRGDFPIPSRRAGSDASSTFKYPTQDYQCEMSQFLFPLGGFV